MFLKNVERVGYIFLEICVFHRFQSLPALCVCVAAACGASAPSEKTRPWSFGVCILRILSFLTISGPPKPFAAVSQLPAALRLPQKKHAPGFWEHASCGFSQFSSILGSPNWYRHRMTPTAATATVAATTSQQPPHPTATSKQTRTGTKYPVQGIPPHSDTCLRKMILKSYQAYVCV